MEKAEFIGLDIFKGGSGFCQRGFLVRNQKPNPQHQLISMKGSIIAVNDGDVERDYNDDDDDDDLH